LDIVAEMGGIDLRHGIHVILMNLIGHLLGVARKEAIEVLVLDEGGLLEYLYVGFGLRELIDFLQEELADPRHSLVLQVGDVGFCLDHRNRHFAPPLRLRLLRCIHKIDFLVQFR